METMNAGSGDTPRRETEADRHARIGWEAKRIAEARAELEAGLYVDAAEIGAWIDSIGTDHESPRRRPAAADRAGLAKAQCRAR